MVAARGGGAHGAAPGFSRWAAGDRLTSIPGVRQPAWPADPPPPVRSAILTTIAPFATLVLLLVWMGFFMLGSLPLLVLKHDTPLDARFIRGLFDVYYKAVMVVAVAGTLTHAWAHRPGTTVGMAAVGGVAFCSRRIVLARMDRVRATMTAHDVPAIRRFRQLHVAGMALNLVQVLVICVALPFVL